MSFLQYSCILFLLFCVAYCPGTTLEIYRLQKLDDDYHVEWRADMTFENITFLITAKTLGYVGFGLSPQGGMEYSDIIIGGVRHGKPYISDCHGEGNWKPVVDKSQDWQLRSASENGTHTTLEVSRVFNTCDNDDLPINNDTTKFIWSIGTTDDLDHHQKRGSASVIILNPVTPPVNITESQVWEMNVKTKLPAMETTYWCTAHKSPPYTSKRHIIGFKVKLETPESRSHTHHLILHQCRASSEELIQLYESILRTPGGLCYEDENIYNMRRTCEHFIYGWAVGADPLYLPENVGVPLNEYGLPEYFLLEIHYDNPSKLSGISYETGIVAYTTTNLREHDTGVLRVGHETVATMIIPPNTSNFVIAGHCGSHCTQSRLPNEGINVFTVFLHSHLAGRKMKLRQFRNGTELPWIAYDNHYDFNYQQNRLLPEYRNIFKGDHLTYECTDDSSNRLPPQAVLGGLGTQNEMCLAFLMYYPRVNSMAHCVSQFDELNVMHKRLGIEEIKWDNFFDPLVKAPPKFANKRYSEVLSIIAWDDSLKIEIQNLTRFGKHTQTCEPWQNGDNNKPVTTVYPENIPYVPEDSCRPS